MKSMDEDLPPADQLLTKFQLHLQLCEPCRERFAAILLHSKDQLLDKIPKTWKVVEVKDEVS